MKPRILYMGTPDFAVPPLRRLLADGFPVAGVVCQPDRPQGRRMKIITPPAGVLAREYGLPLLQPENVRTPEFEAAVRRLSPDMIVTAAYGRILPAGILAIPPMGCLNIHASLLPAYRGAAPVQWCLINGESETGITIMLMNEGMDTGDILLAQSLVIPEDINAGDLSSLLSDMGAGLLPAAIDGFLSGRLKPAAQDHSRATTIRMLTRESGKIDWRLSAREIRNLIRGTFPWPGAYTICGDKLLKILKARVSDDPGLIAAATGLPAGTICACRGDAISVACGEGVLDLLEVQSDSGKKLRCRDCAHNYRLGQTMGGE